ncbi:MAG: hypothetical protein A2174_03190 [Candidatus Portnoybacteria bacterium RBG_13_41_18]|uniref:Uncharacterized protein n=1 Tax=Candidatus Portnoybacteria bacterium RBG_13_41_18 TaxID=1801991 RepID=A0A1G2F5A5_9BACT|nr:MAG: hypothetical protein A2174_03190 [Candidatus Portnoybacteria bacterium RBG_13_41_18]
MENQRLLVRLAKIFDKLKIPYFITGGIATVIWGRPRFTADIDIVIQLVANKLDQLALALFKIDKDVYLDKSMMAEALRQQGEFNFIYPRSGLKVDFWILKNTPIERVRLKRRVAKKIGGRIVYFSSPEDLILSKLLWYKETHSTRQLEDIESVLRISGSKINMRYLKTWADQLNVLEILDRLLEGGPSDIDDGKTHQK